MVFDRSALSVGRRIQDIGLSDLKGVYQNTEKLRTKGWLVLAFLDSHTAGSAAMLEQLVQWTGDVGSDKVSFLGVVEGDRRDAESFAKQGNGTFPVVWDIDEYALAIYGLTGTPTTFITDSKGLILCKVVGSDREESAGAFAVLKAQIEKAEAAAKAAAEAAAAQAAATKP